MSAFAQWLMGFARTFLTWLYNNGIDLINGAISGFCTFALTLISYLPTTSLPTAPSAPGGTIMSSAVSLLNWLLPMQYLLSMVGFLATGIIVYASLSPLLRWAKLWK